MPNKEYVSGHRSKRTNMVAKCKIFMNCSKNLKRHLQKVSMTTKHRILRDHGCEGTDMAYKYKIFDFVKVNM